MKSLNYITLCCTITIVVASTMFGGVCAFGQTDSTQIKEDTIVTITDLELKLHELEAEIMQLQKQVEKYDKDKKLSSKQIIKNRIAGGIAQSVIGISLIIGGSNEKSGILTVPLYIAGFGATIPGFILLFSNIHKLNKLKNQERQQSKLSFGIQSNGIGVAYHF